MLSNQKTYYQLDSSALLLSFKDQGERSIISGGVIITHSLSFKKMSAGFTRRSGP